MKISPRTKENFISACLSQAAVARSLRVSTATFNQVLNGTYPCIDGEEAQKVVAFLRDKGLLVLEEDEPLEAA